MIEPTTVMETNSQLDVDWLNKALEQLEQLNFSPSIFTNNLCNSPKQAQNSLLCAVWKQCLLPQFKATTSGWWKIENKTKTAKTEENEDTSISAQHSFLLALSRFTFLLPESEHAEVAQTLVDFAYNSCSGGGIASSTRETWLTEATIKLVAQNMQFYDHVLKLPAKVDLLEWICDRMSSVTVVDAVGFTGPLLHYLQDQLDDLYNLPLKKRFSLEHKEEKVALIYKISKVVYWINYLLGPRNGRSKCSSKVKDLDMVTETLSFSEEELSSSNPTEINDSDILEEEEDQEQSEVAENSPKEENFKENSNEIYQEVIDVATAFEHQQKVNVETKENSVSNELLSSDFGNRPSSIAFDVNSLSSDDNQQQENSKLKKKKLRLRRHVLRRLRRLCRNIRDDCDYQLKKCGH